MKFPVKIEVLHCQSCSVIFGAMGEKECKICVRASNVLVTSHISFYVINRTWIRLVAGAHKERMDATSPPLEQDQLTEVFPVGILIMPVGWGIFLVQNRSDSLARLLTVSPIASVTLSPLCRCSHFFDCFLINLLEETILINYYCVPRSLS